MVNRLSHIFFLFICLSFELCRASSTLITNVQDLSSAKDVLIDQPINLGKSTSLIVKCERSIFVKRIEYTIDCDSIQNINGTDYYISGRCIEVGSREKLSVPPGLLLFDTNYKLLQNPNGDFQSASYSSKVRFGSRRRGIFSCSHSKVFYICNNAISIPSGKGLFIPQNCIIVNAKGEVLTHEGFYYPRHANTERIKIACTQNISLELKMVPVIKLQDDCQLTFKDGGILSNGIIVCEGLTISSLKNSVFNNIILSGSIKNKALLVEWFGCCTYNDGEHNKDILKQFIIPSAIACRSDVFHSAKGTYQITGAYPTYNALWGFDHAYIKDFRGITVYGTGPATIILSCMPQKDTPSDIFNIVDSKNLTIRDLSVTHQKVGLSIKNGSNAFSLVHSNEDISIDNCSVYNMPYVVGPVYPDGGKAFTIQAGPNTNQHNIKILNNKAEGVSYGLDYTKTSFSEGDNLVNIVFEGNVIHNAIVGAVVHEWDSPYGEIVNPVIVNNNTIKDCQVGILCQTTKSCNITNNLITNNKRPSRLLYYKGVYGILTLGAYNTTIERNQIELKDGDAFLNVNVYSYYPRFNGAVKNMTIKKNVMRGKASDTSVRVGKKTMTKEESKMFVNINILENTIKQ